MKFFIDPRPMRTAATTLSALLLLALLVFASGCQTDDNTENASARPWNTPKSWEGGFPTGLTEGR
jgi:hypothetical protein